MPAPNASYAEKQAALVEFRKALQARMTRTNDDEVARLTKEIIKLRKTKRSFEGLQKETGIDMSGMVDLCSRQLDELWGEVRFQRSTDWNDLVDRFLEYLGKS